MKKVMKYISVALFFATLGIFMILTVILPKSDFSDMENRPLADLPEASAERIFDKSFMNETDEYISDHFAFRNSLARVKLQMEMILGRKEQNGVLITDQRMIELVPEADRKNVESSVAAINHLADTTSAQVYVMIPPTAAGVYAGDIPDYYQNVDQRKQIDDIYFGFSDKITTLNVFSKLYSSRDEYIYYRSDHHWTSYGAYLAYSSVVRKMGYNPTPMSMFDIEHVNSEFYGTLFSKTLYGGTEPDVIDVFHPKTGIDAAEVTVGQGENAVVSKSMYFSDYLKKKDKYSFYLGNAMEPVVTVRTNLEGGEKLLVIKDSYAQCFIPFLTQHFSEITAVDLRSISPFEIASVLNVDAYDKILVLYNYSGFVNDVDLKKLSALK